MQLATEEQTIRKDPVAQTTALLKKVFGGANRKQTDWTAILKKGMTPHYRRVSVVLPFKCLFTDTATACR
jgi:hypothetical protein